MTRRCEETVPLLGPLVDGELARDDRAWVQEHLDGCASCRDRALLLRAQASALREAVSAQAALAPLDGFADRVLSRVAREAGTRKPWDRIEVWAADTLLPHRLGIGASAGAALAAAFAVAFLLRPPAGELLVARSDVAAQVASASIDALDLDDRSNGAVLQLRGMGTGGPPTTVIWVSDESAPGVPQ